MHTDRLIQILAVLTLSATAGRYCPADAPTSQPATASAPAQSLPHYTTRDRHDPNGIGKFYMGREIARVMGHEGAGWLERPERSREERPDQLLGLLGLRPGMSVADIGAGTGYHTLPIAETVGNQGRVYAVEIQPEMLDLLEQKLVERKLDNVKSILGKVADPRLADNSVDLVLMVDVYHEFEFPFEMMQHIIRATRPGGKIVLVEFRAEDPKVPIKLVHKMSLDQVRKEMAPMGLEYVKTNSSLPWQHVIFFRKPAVPDQRSSFTQPGE